MDTCRRCGTVRDRGDAAALAWALDRDDGELRWLCPPCSRVHIRDIEARLAPEWWE